MKAKGTSAAATPPKTEAPATAPCTAGAKAATDFVDAQVVQREEQ